MAPSVAEDQESAAMTPPRPADSEGSPEGSLDRVRIEPKAKEVNEDEKEGNNIESNTTKVPLHAPPLPREDLPPLPTEPAPGTEGDDGWQPIWDDNAQTFFFFNKFTQETTWTNPRVPEALIAAAPGVANHDRIGHSIEALGGPPESRPHGGYDPAIHGDYDPTAPYAQGAQAAQVDVEPEAVKVDENAIYTATGTFNRFTGKWQSAEITPENHNDENKSRRQMNAFFDVDAAANNHNGKSLKAERSGKKLSKQEIKQFKEKRREKKEEKRRAWLRD
jgi:hypothetical protein